MCKRQVTEHRTGVRPKRVGYILTGVGLILSLLVGVLVYSQVADAERVKASLPTTQVIVAAVDIPPRSEIATAMLAVQVIPDQLMQVGAATRVEEVAGKFTPQAPLNAPSPTPPNPAPIAAPRH